MLSATVTIENTTTAALHRLSSDALHFAFNITAKHSSAKRFVKNRTTEDEKVVALSQEEQINCERLASSFAGSFGQK